MQAQDSPSIQNLQNLNVDDLSDDQIKKFIQQVESSGYSQQQLELLARARGMSETQISKLRNRISQLQSGQTEGQTGSGVSRLRESPTFRTDRETPFDPFADIIPTDTIKQGSELPIFGMSFFENENLTFEPSLSIATPKDYMIGPGDQIIIDVWGASEQTYQLDVSPEGNIRIPSLGPIYLNGLTVEQADSRIKSRLKSIYSTLGNNTFAQISLGQIRTISVNVIGEVKRPGTYSMSSFGTAFNALYYAGGPTETGSLRDIQVFRGGKRINTLDAYNFLIYGEGQNIMLQDNDVVLVRPFQNRVGIDGEVKRPAYYEMKDGESLEKAIGFAGGFSSDAYRGSISLRRNLSNKKALQTVSTLDFAQFTLQGGDFIEVGKITNQFSNRVRIEGAVNHSGEFELKEDMMLSDLLSLAEGFRGDAFMGRGVIIRQNKDFTLSSIAFSPTELTNGSYDLQLQNGDQVKIQSIFDLKEAYNVTVQGEVQKPGSYPFVKGMTVENLIYLANGFKESAARSSVEVARRVREDIGDEDISSEVFTFPIDQSLSISDQASDFELQPFDLVVIRKSPFYEKQTMIEIEGEVKFPGKYALKKKDERISDVLFRAGNLTAYAYPKGATLIRRTEYYVTDEEGGDEAARIRRQELQELFERDTVIDNTQQAFKTQESIGIQLEEILKNHGSRYDLILKEGDVISIPRELQTVRVRGEVLYPSTVRYDNSLSFKQIISQAGGFSDQAKKGKAYVVYANGSAERTRKFLWFKDYPRVEPGAEIIIPEKTERRKLSPGEIISITSGIGTIALIINNLTK
ncbi:MAG: SLBB domain-containing protein [Bacteroidota bacterium]